LIVASFDGSFKKFVSSRSHMFTPLENITIYTTDDSEPLKNVFLEMKSQFADKPPIDPKSSGNDLREYFTSILPDHDPEKVYTSDIKKIIKWYHELEEAGLIVEDEEEKEEEEIPAEDKREETEPEEPEEPEEESKEEDEIEKGAE
jgi:lipoate-protein ligase A